MEVPLTTAYRLKYAVVALSLTNDGEISLHLTSTPKIISVESPDYCRPKRIARTVAWIQSSYTSQLVAKKQQTLRVPKYYIRTTPTEEGGQLYITVLCDVGSELRLRRERYIRAKIIIGMKKTKNPRLFIPTREPLPVKVHMLGVQTGCR